MIWGPHPKYGTYIIYWFNFETGMWRISIVYFRFFCWNKLKSGVQVAPHLTSEIQPFPKKTLVFLGKNTEDSTDEVPPSPSPRNSVSRAKGFGLSKFQLQAAGLSATGHALLKRHQILFEGFCCRKSKREIKHKRNRVKVKGIGQKIRRW